MIRSFDHGGCCINVEALSIILFGLWPCAVVAVLGAWTTKMLTRYSPCSLAYNAHFTGDFPHWLPRVLLQYNISSLFSVHIFLKYCPASLISPYHFSTYICATSVFHILRPRPLHHLVRINELWSLAHYEWGSWLQFSWYQTFIWLLYPPTLLSFIETTDIVIC